MTTPEKSQQLQSVALWKVKLQLASQGSYQAIQQVKEHVLQQTDEQHPIFKQSFYDILQQGYLLHALDANTRFGKNYETYRDFPLLFLVSGAVQVKCINLEGDNDTVTSIKTKGLVAVQQPVLAKKYGQQNVNLLTKFQIHARQASLLLQILGTNKIQEILQRKQISEKESNVMRRFMIFPSKEVVRVTVNSTNQEHIKDRIYLMSGKACLYLDDEKEFGKRLILACYEEGYLNPKQFGATDSQDGSSGSIPSSFNLAQKNKNQTAKQKQKQRSKIKLYIFQQSEIMYLEQNFLKDDLVKAIELKRQQHISQIVEKYKSLQGNPQAIEAAQNQLIMRFKLSKKQINSQIHRIAEAKKDKGFMTAKEMSGTSGAGDRKLKNRTDLISTSSSMKCSIRIRKSKKIV